MLEGGRPPTAASAIGNSQFAGDRVRNQITRLANCQLRRETRPPRSENLTETRKPRDAGLTNCGRPPQAADLHLPEPPLPPPVLRDAALQVGGAEIGPQGLREQILGIGGLPEEEVARPQLAAGP